MPRVLDEGGKLQRMNQEVFMNEPVLTGSLQIWHICAISDRRCD